MSANPGDASPKILTVRTPGEANALLARLHDSALLTINRLRDIIKVEPDPLKVLSKLKFEPIGCDPLSPTRCLNVIEQVNQLFTYQASFRAAAWLLEHHRVHVPLVLHLGTTSGADIRSEDGEVVAEVFASVDPRNNRKLAKEIERLEACAATFRYVFYLSPKLNGMGDEYEVGGISVRRLSTEERD